MNKQLSKQIIYGGGFLSVVLLILTASYLLWFRSEPSCFDGRWNQEESGVDCGGPCQDCEIKTLVPISERWLKYFSVDGKTVITAEIKNSNTDYAASGLSYVFDIYGKDGSKIKSIARKSFIYAEEIKCLFEQADVKFQEIGEIKISFSALDWKRKGEFSQPKIQKRQLITSFQDNQTGAETSGTVVNDNPFSLSKLRIIGFLLNKNGMELGVSKTELENLRAFEERPFKIIFPKNISLTSGDSSGSSLDFNLADPNKTKICIEASR
ncbi:MAG: hypothetical protein AAB366_00945 [Patescibacteria group bacterium]